MEAPTNSSTNFCDPVDSSIIFLDGYGVSLSVSRGHLVISDGLGRHRRERRLPRAQRAVRRIVLLGHTGHVTLDAIRWCHDTRISITTIDPDGRILLTAGSLGRDDARLRRAQAAAANSPVGVEIAKALIGAKIDGQAAVLGGTLGTVTAADTLTGVSEAVRAADGLLEIRALEASASSVYFGAWTGTVTVRFAGRDLARVPDAWHGYGARRSPINRSSPRTAADPVNAMLNYSYALAEAEARLAIQAVGLDPGLGIVHTDAKNRDSLALDLLEPLRPIADRHVLTLLARRYLTRGDVHETRTGCCRLLPALTHALADAIPDYGAVAARLAEQLAHALARSAPGTISLTTPLSRTNTANTQIRGARSQHRRAEQPAARNRRTCQQCGTNLYGSARKLCPTCWPVARREYMRQLGLDRAKPQPDKPTAEQLSGGISFADYQNTIMPALRDVELRDMERATGMANSSCCRIRAGKQIPNPRHWRALAALAARPTA